MRILVIEGDERVRSFTSNGLRQEGHIVDDTPFGKDGLSYWANVDYDAVILDLALPEMDGISILESMRRKGNKTPAIIVSAKKTAPTKTATKTIRKIRIILFPLLFSFFIFVLKNKLKINY